VNVPFLIKSERLDLYLRDIQQYKPLSREEEYECAVKITKGNKRALSRLVNANLRFVVSVARNYENQGLPLVDLINEGNLGLIRAAKRFDEKKNFKFISYAVWWIRQSILQALAENSRIVRVPLNRVGTIHRVEKARSRLEQKYHRLPDNDEVARELGIKEENVHISMQIGSRHTSLDAPINPQQKGTGIELLQDGDQDEPDEDTVEDSLKTEVASILDTLSEKERLVICSYYGIGEEADFNLEEIGDRMGITRERVRQIKERALSKLKNSRHLQNLKNEYV